MKNKPFANGEYPLCTKKAAKEHVLFRLNKKNNFHKNDDGEMTRKYFGSFHEYFGLEDDKNIHKDNLETMIEITHLHNMLKHKFIRAQYPALNEQRDWSKDMVWMSEQILSLTKRAGEMESSYSQISNRIEDLERAVIIKFPLRRRFPEPGPVMALILSAIITGVFVLILHLCGVSLDT